MSIHRHATMRMNIFTPRVEIHIKDKADIPIVNAAIAAGIHVFVTGDKELQDLERIGNLKIISPRKFWELLKI